MNQQKQIKKYIIKKTKQKKKKNQKLIYLL